MGKSPSGGILGLGGGAPKAPAAAGRPQAAATPSVVGRGAAPAAAPPAAWGGLPVPNQAPEVIPGQVKPVKGDPGSATVTGYRQPPPAAPAGGGGDSNMRSLLAQLMMRQNLRGGGNAGYGGGDRGYWRSPAGQETMAMYGAPPYPVR